MNSSDRSRQTPLPSVWHIAVLVALAAGVVDVSIALLGKPQDFGRLGALSPPILATAALVFTGYLTLWAVVRPAIRRVTTERRAFAVAAAAMLLCAFTLARLAGVEAGALTPHAIFRLAIIAVVSTFTGAGVYAACAGFATRADAAGYCGAALVAAPLLLFEVLLFEWIEVYAIDSATSVASMAAALGLAIAGAATVAWFLRIRDTRIPARATGLLLAALIAMPAIDSQAIGNAVAARGNVQASAPVPARIILVSVDTLRADALSTYSPGARRTPAIDRLASDAVVFEHAISPAPWTLPSVTSLLSGLSPAVHLVTDLDSRLSDRVTTLAERLSARGYETAAIVHNPLFSPARRLDQGFQQYVDLHEPSFGDSLGARLLQASLPATFHPSSWPSTSDQADRAIAWLEANRDRNFFLWVHFFDPHAPYAPPATVVSGQPPAGLGFRYEGQSRNTPLYLVPPPAERAWIRGLYDAETADVDANIGRLTQALKQLNLYDGSLIVFTSDHGEEFWEHGGQGHGQSLHGELVHVPLIVKLPGSASGRRIPIPVSTVSVTPSILDLSGIRYAAGDVSAPSLAPLLTEGAGHFEPQPIVSMYVQTSGSLVDRREAVTFGSFRYIASPLEGSDELFDTDQDPAERHSLSASAPEQVATGRKLLAQQFAAAAALGRRLQIEPGSVDIDADTAQRLRTLGYLR